MSKITITIFGTTAGVPTKERAHSAIYLNYDDGGRFCCLFDCGEGTQRQFMRAGLSMMKIDDIFITHWHGDHCLGLPGMVDTMGFEDRKRPLKVYAPEARRIQRSLSVTHSMGGFKITPVGVPARGGRATRLLETERFKIVSMPVKHSVPAVAYSFMGKDKACIDLEKARASGLPEEGEIYKRLKQKGRVRIDGRLVALKDVSRVKKGKKIVYSGDTEICDNLGKLVHGADLLIQDCTYFEDPGPDRPHQHAALPEIIKMVENENVKRVILTHVSRKYRNAEELEGLIKEYPHIELAKDFIKIEV